VTRSRNDISGVHRAVWPRCDQLGNACVFTIISLLDLNCTHLATPISIVVSVSVTLIVLYDQGCERGKWLRALHTMWSIGSQTSFDDLTTNAATKPLSPQLGGSLAAAVPTGDHAALALASHHLMPRLLLVKPRSTAETRLEAPAKHPLTPQKYSSHQLQVRR